MENSGQNFGPSKKVISFLIISVALVTTIIILFKPAVSVTQNKNLSQNLGSLTGGPVVGEDLDLNWQEDLENIAPPTQELDSDNSSETLTDQFSRSLMANYLSLKESGAYDGAAAQTLLEKSSDFLISSPNFSYTTKDIVVNPDNSKVVVFKYGNDLGAAFKVNTPVGEKKNEVAIFGQLMQTKDESKVLELQNVASVYRNTALSLSKITVPSSFSGDHLKLLNAVNNLSTAVSAMAQGLEDPLKSIQGLTLYKKSVDEALAAHKSLGKAIFKAGGNYKQGDNGYYFYFSI